MIFLTETKCKIRFTYVGFNCKGKKSGVKKGWSAIKGGGPNGHFKFSFFNPFLTVAPIFLFAGTPCWTVFGNDEELNQWKKKINKSNQHNALPPIFLLLLICQLITGKQQC